MNMKFVRTFAMLALTLVIGLSVTGGTIAWFTDNVTSSANVIQAGNLDVELYHTNKNVTTNEKVSEATKLFVIKEGTLWEPGVVTYENLTVKNEGNLSLYYDLGINVSDENYVDDGSNQYGLSSALKMAVVDGGVTGTTREEVLAQATNGAPLATAAHTGTLEPGASKVYGLIVYWEPSADDNNWNVNNSKTVTPYKGTAAEALMIDLGVKLQATQLEAEEDAFDPNYDINAKYYINFNDLQAAINNGGVVGLGKDITLPEGESLEIPAGKNVTLLLGGKKLIAPSGTYAINNKQGGTLIIDDPTNTGSITGVIYTENSSTTVKNGTFNAADGERYVFLNYKGTLTLDGGIVNSGSSYPIYSYNSGHKLVINDVTVNGIFGAVNTYGGGTVEINGGTFKMTGVQGNTSHIAYFSQNDVVTINGGTFQKTGDINMSAPGGGGICAIYGANLTITGGNFAGDYEDIYNWGGTGTSIQIKGGTFKFKPKDAYLASGYIVKNNDNGTWTASYDGSLVSSAAELTTALSAGKNILLASDISYDAGIIIPEGISFDGNGKTITYSGTQSDYQLVKLNTGAELKNVNLENYRVKTEKTTNGTVTMKNVKISMDNDLTGLDISLGSGTAKLTNVTCKGIKDAVHLDPNTKVQVDYTPYGDVLLGTKWGLEATNCDFGSLHGWNTTNSSNVSLNSTKYTVFRMHYWNNRTLYIDGVQTAWSDSGAIPVAHDVGGCWSVQPAFK